MSKKCPMCDGQLIDEETSITLKRYGQEFTYHNVKTEICLNCGDKFYDGRSIMNIEREIEETVVEKAA